MKYVLVIKGLSSVINQIIFQSTSDPYAFIEFAQHQAAAHALLAMNKRLVMGREIKVNWATTSTSATNKTDTSSECIHNRNFILLFI